MQLIMKAIKQQISSFERKQQPCCRKACTTTNASWYNNAKRRYKKTKNFSNGKRNKNNNNNNQKPHSQARTVLKVYSTRILKSLRRRIRRQAQPSPATCAYVTLHATQLTWFSLAAPMRCMCLLLFLYIVRSSVWTLFGRLFSCCFLSFGTPAEPSPFSISIASDRLLLLLPFVN